MESLPLILGSLIAFVAFGMCASSAYLLNDLLDLEDDRHQQLPGRTLDFISVERFESV